MSGSFLGFNDPQSIEEIINLILEDQDDRRWQPARTLHRMEDPEERLKARCIIDQHLNDVGADWRLRYRLMLAKRALDAEWPEGDWVIERCKGVVKSERIEPELPAAGNHIIDFHVHPKMFDAGLMNDISEAGLTGMVILATDTDPANVDREDIQRSICEMHVSSFDNCMAPPGEIISEIRDSLYSPTHVTNQDVADWVSDYPEQLIGFGSVDLCKSADYVDSTLLRISELGLSGIKLLPFSQFFDPETNENMHILFEHCRKNNWPILTHTGCSSGVFEDPAFNQCSRPSKWKALAKQYPDVPIVMAHLGAYSMYYPGIWLEEAADMIGSFDNVYSDTAAVCGLLNNEEAVRLIRKKAGGFDHILFGTDYPMPTLMAPDGEALIVNEIRESRLLTDIEKENILGRNAARLLGL